MCEGLETRTLMSVTADADGWTVVTPSSDSRVIYVSDAGSDAGNGASPSAAVATIAKARTLVRSGFPDQILLRRGDTFVGQTISSWNLSGRDADEPFVIGAYTDPSRPSSQRPTLATGIKGGISFTTSTPVRHVYVMGVAFEAHSRNYRQPPGNGDTFTTGVLSEGQGGTYGLRVLGTTSDLHVEDCSFQYYRTNVTLQTTTDGSGKLRPVTDVRLRRNVILDAYAPNVDEFGITYQHTSEGIYAGGYVSGLTIEGNVLSHNGWANDNALGAVGGIYSHNTYVNTNVDGLVFTNNVVADGASHGLQARSGGIVKDNLFLRNPIAMSYGYANSPVRPGGVSGEISGNVVVGTARMFEAGRGWGLELSNLKRASLGGGTVVRNNVYANDLATGGESAIKLDIGNVPNASQDVGVNDLLLENNVVYSWARGMYVNSGFNNTGHDRYRPLRGLVVRGNDFQRVFSGSGPIVDHSAPFVASAEQWSGNRYDGTRADTGSTRWFRVAGASTTFDQWKATREPTAQRAQGLFPDPGRTAGEYNATLGGADSTDAFIDEARRQSGSYWRPAYAARAANEYLRAGYAGGRVDIAAPTASAAAANVTVAGAAAYTFTVTYSDDNKLDLATLGAGDVRVVGPDGYSAAATLVESAGNAEGDRRTVTYSVAAPDGRWSADANGLYSVVVQADAVRDVTGKAVAADPAGSFSVTIDPAVPGAVASAPGIGRDNAPAVVTVTYTGGTTPALPTSVSPLNAGFETPNVGADAANAYQYAPAGGDWAFDATSGISGNNSDITWSNPAAPQGAQVAFIRGTGTISQSVADWQAGTYTVAFTAAQRGPSSVGSQTVQVQVDGQPVGAFTPAGSTYESFTTAPFTVPAGAHTIGFVGLDTAGGENTVLLDDVRVTGSTTPAQQSIQAASLGAGDVRLTGPNGYSAAATSAVAAAPGADGSPMVVTYTVPAPAGGWSSVAADASYPVNVVAAQVRTTSGVAVPAAKVGAVRVKIDAPAATVSAANVTAASAAAHTFTVTYVDSGGTGGGGGIAPSIGSADLRVTGPNGFNAPVTLVGFTGTGSTASPLVATYRVAAPAGGWGGPVNGAYFVNAQANQVTDADGNALPAGSIGQFQVAVDTTPPLAWANENPIENPTPLGGTPAAKTIAVSYSDPSGINLTTLDNSDVRVTGPAGFDQPLTKGAVTPSPTAASVQYALAAPAGGWKSRHNGAYNIVLQPGQVRDTVGNALTAARTLDTFEVKLETVGPAAQVGPVTPSPRNTAVAGTTVTFGEVVTGVDLADLSLRRDGASVSLAGATLTTTDNKTYTLGVLAGLTGGAGTYALTLTAAGSGIADLAGNALAADAAASWAVDLAAPTPSASATDITDRSAAGHAITVTYADNFGIDASTLDDSDLLVTGPNGYSALAALVSVSGSGASRTAVYAATPPAGGWTGVHAGRYAVALRANQVADTTGNFSAAGVVGSFAVAIDATPPTASIDTVTPNPRKTPVDAVPITFSEPVTGFDLADLALTRDAAAVALTGASLTTSDDVTFTLSGLGALTKASGNYVLKLTASGSGILDVTGYNPLAADAATTWVVDVTGPAASASATDITDRSAAGHAITVTYADNFGIDASTLDDSDLLVTGPNGYSALAALVSVSGSDTSRVAVYAAAPPEGGWHSGDNGTYAVTLRAGQVADALGNVAAGGALGSFDVSFDTAAPTASVGPVTPNPRNTAVAGVAVTFSEPVTGFALADLALTHNGSPVSLAGATLSTTDDKAFAVNGLSAATRAAGTYALTVRAAGSGIADQAGNAMTADAAARWTTDLTAPAVAVGAVSPSPRPTPVESVTVTFSEPVVGFGPADLALTRDGAAVSLAGVTVSPVAGSGVAYTVGGLTAATTPAGAYVLGVTAAGSGIADPAGNALATGTSTAFTVSAPDPAQPLTLRAAADTFVRDGSTYANVNYGTAGSMHVKRGSSVGVTREAYLRFDLAAVASVGTAKLRLYGKVDSTANASVAFAVYNATDTTWGETAINWNTRPVSSTAASGSATVSGTIAKWYEVDVTTLLQQRKAAGATAVTLVLKGTATSSSFLVFNSDEATAGNGPQLVVTPAGPTPQGLVVSASSLSVPEGGNAAFTVKLAAQPAANVVVSVARAAGGDADLTTATPSLTFTPANWNVAQSVAIAAAQDADTTNGTASFTVSSAGLAAKTVTATEIDNDTPAGPVTLGAGADAYVRDGWTYANTNFGTASQLQVKQGAAGWNRDGYLRFNLSGVSTTIASAKLRLFGKLDNTQAASAGFTVFNAENTTWSETAMTWNTKPAAGTTARGGGTVAGTTGKWYEVDLTAFLKAEKAAGRNAVTLVLKATAASAATVVFDSNEGANRPQLVVG